MKINNLTAGTVAAVFSQATATNTGACPASISDVEIHDPVAILVNCANVAAPASVSETTYAALYAGCLAPLASAAGDSFPANSGTSKVCRDCYVRFAQTMVEAGLGSLDSAQISIDAPALTLTNICGDVTEDTAKEDCYKDSHVIQAMNDFQTCAGYSMNFKSPTSLARRRLLNTHDVYPELVRAAFNDRHELSLPIATLLARDTNSDIASPEISADLCYVMFHDYLQTYAATGIASIINDCGSTGPTVDGCLDTEPVQAARDRFVKCGDYEIGVWYDACTATELEALAGSYDAYKTLVEVVIANREETDAVKLQDAVYVVLDKIAAVTGEDCMECFSELAYNILEEIGDASKEYANAALMESYLSSCDDPSSDACLVVIGRESLAAFKKCSGFELNRTAFVSTATPTTPTVTTAIPPATNSTTTAAPTSKSSGLVAPLASMVILAIGSALVL